MANNKEERVYLSEGLQGLDDKVEKLLEIWETRIQLSTIEASSPDLDFFTFAQGVPFFAVIMSEECYPGDPVQKIVSAESPVMGRKLFEYRLDDEDDSHTLRSDSSSTPNDHHPVPSSSSYHPSDDRPDDTLPPSHSHSTFQRSSGGRNSQYRSFPSYDQHPAFERASRSTILGMVYLAYYHGLNGVTANELNVGIALAPEHEGKGYAQKAMEIVLEHAFETLRVHRVQALLIGQPMKERALNLFFRMKFIHEGTRRLSFFSPIEQEWKDTTTLAMVVTDWAMRAVRSAPATLWDEMLARHQRERNQLLQWDERKGRYSCDETATEGIPTPTRALTPTGLPNSLWPWSGAEESDAERSPGAGSQKSEKGKEKEKAKEKGSPEAWFDFDNEDFYADNKVKESNGHSSKSLMAELSRADSNPFDDLPRDLDSSPESLGHFSSGRISLPPDSDFENLASGSDWDMMDEDGEL